MLSFLYLSPSLSRCRTQSACCTAELPLIMIYNALHANIIIAIGNPGSEVNFENHNRCSGLLRCTIYFELGCFFGNEPNLAVLCVHQSMLFSSNDACSKISAVGALYCASIRVCSLFAHTICLHRILHPKCNCVLLGRFKSFDDCDSSHSGLDIAASASH